MEQQKGPSSTVQKHRGEPDTRDRHTNLTNTSTLRLTRQTTPEPRNARVATNHRSPLTRSSAVVVTDIRTLGLIPILFFCVSTV
jgi:hypothetical protein